MGRSGSMLAGCPRPPVPLVMPSRAKGLLLATSAHPQSDLMGSPLLPPHC